MADIPIKFYKSVVRSQKFNPSNPPDLEDPAPVVNPPGTVPTTLYKLLGDVTDTDFIGKNGFIPVVVGENVLTLQSLTTNVLSTPLTGYVVGANTAISASNTILTAFQQVQGQINSRVSGTIATGQVAFGTGVNTVGGNAEFIWDSVNNRLGIGATPLSTFYISRLSGSASIADPTNNAISVRRSDSPVVFGMGWLSTNQFYLQGKHATNGVSTFNILLNPSGGAVGIGTSSPSTTFHVNTANIILFESPAADLSILQFKTTSGSIYLGQRINGEFGIGSTNLLTSSIFYAIPSTQRVGINTIAPSHTFDVNGTARIRTISNGTGDFLTKDATGVITSRTAAQTLTDIGGLSSSSLSIASGQVAFGTGVNTVGGDSGLVWDNTTKQFSVSGSSYPVMRLNRNTVATNTIVFPYDLKTTTPNDMVVDFGTGMTFTLQDNTTTSIIGRIQFLRGSTDLVGRFQVVTGTAATVVLSTSETGNLGILTVTPTNTLDVNGTARIRTISNGVGDFLTKDAVGVITARTAAEVVTDLGIGTGLWTAVGSDIYRNSAVAIGRTTIPLNTTFVVQSKVSGSANVFLLQNDSGGDLVQINNLAYYGFTGPDFVIGQSAVSGSNFIYKSNLNGVNNTVFSIKDSLNVDAARWGANGNYYQKSHIVNIGSTASGYEFLWQGSSTSGGVKGFALRNGAGSEGFYMKGDLGVVILNPRLSIGSDAGSVVNGVYIQGNSNTNQVLGISNNSAVRIFDVYGNGNIGVYDSGNVILGTTTGTKIGTATNQKLSFWDKTPIIQPTTAYASSVLVSLGGTTITDTDTFDGYTLKQIVSALRGIGLLA